MQRLGIAEPSALLCRVRCELAEAVFQLHVPGIIKALAFEVEYDFPLVDRQVHEELHLHAQLDSGPEPARIDLREDDLVVHDVERFTVKRR